MQVGLQQAARSSSSDLGWGDAILPDLHQMNVGDLPDNQVAKVLHRTQGSDRNRYAMQVLLHGVQPDDQGIRQVGRLYSFDAGPDGDGAPPAPGLGPDTA